MSICIIALMNVSQFTQLANIHKCSVIRKYLKLGKIMQVPSTYKIIAAYLLIYKYLLINFIRKYLNLGKLCKGLSGLVGSDWGKKGLCPNFSP